MSELNQLQKWRREFHHIPESGWCEFITTSKIITILRGMGWQVITGNKYLSTEYIMGRNATEVADSIKRAVDSGVPHELLDEMDGFTGCVALWDTGKNGAVTAFRFDIDCVQVSESKSKNHIPEKMGFASIHSGLMHACGHDGHISIGLGLAQWVSENNHKLCGKIKLIFQAAEEGVRGAKPIAEGGILDDCDYFLSSHIGMGVPTGNVVASPTDLLCTTKMDFFFYGTPAHAGVNPHLGNNALAAACHCATQLLAIPRHGEGMSRINIGTLNAGEGRNIIPSFARMQLEVRGETETINQYMREHALKIAQGISSIFGLRFEYKVVGEATDLHNDPLLVNLIHYIAQEDMNMSLTEKSFGGSEDATLLIRRVQKIGGKAAYIILGSDLKAGHHEVDFDFDENVLDTGVKLFSLCLERLNSPGLNKIAGNGKLESELY
ncbi:TPA: amidohydrolase [Escherichia coli]|uniref:amidohydrolase n=1 Tax=Escherichia coli TaxID=562 RepID=UPI001819C3A6|nr:amidohydrolase [Escherichia coli]HDQ6721203.1 amidohydrolase [Escherichia coli O146:H21]HDQ6880788.1 amidohydrolase [Escherichia coli O174:H8]EEV0615533.1 M20 family metallo-hydrolase [Escherichia coli]EEZ0748189.1 M20 family metallo-hydrolase [Escherichia coli]EEZ2633073.1 M20 family metallo-hydrolase [Escherichia coli]